MACLGARRFPGTEVVLDAVGIDRILPGATLVVTGEGSLDPPRPDPEPARGGQWMLTRTGPEVRSGTGWRSCGVVSP
ncbi:glycerate kinase [Streptacidiphilus alkalitolerans]|uniref:glycerate kinase n=1 Tax=Streptacidiphilus alkalitolerans TaxID=3342712 RepID=UPI0039F197CF